jgi:hypothetical protein
LSYYSLAISHYDTLNDSDSTMFYEIKIKNALKLAAPSNSNPQSRGIKQQKKVAQMKLELHTINTVKGTLLYCKI